MNVRAAAGRPSRASAVAATAAVLVTIAGCASTVGRYDFLDRSYPERPTDAPVEVFATGEPSRAYVRVARLDAHLEKTGFMRSSLDEALPELKRQARRAGCDAIVEISERRSESSRRVSTTRPPSEFATSTDRDRCLTEGDMGVEA